MTENDDYDFLSRLDRAVTIGECIFVTIFMIVVLVALVSGCAAVVVEPASPWAWYPASDRHHPGTTSVR